LKIIEALTKFRNGARAGARVEKMSHPAEETMRLLAQGKSLEEVARLRDRQMASVTSLVADLVEQGRIEYQPEWVELSRRTQIEEACSKLGIERFKPLKDSLPEEITYDEIRLVVAQLRRKQNEAAQSVAIA
jgi:ATP-dependent DNA helicase RecQ